uniref:Transmembrane protein n=1 Tax=Ditylenchus dipsaci TaxID=166011 RepID=A0A915DVZ5_9BILA
MGYSGSNWIRCLTVCGYIFFVSSPAVLLSYYYTKVWNPKYVNRLVSPPTVYKSKSAPSSSLSPNHPPHSPQPQPLANVLKLYQQNSHEESHKRSREMSIPMQNKGKDVALEDVLVRRLPAT